MSDVISLSHKAEKAGSVACGVLAFDH